ncbi:lipid A deacylase LpxR family protein [Polaribacter aquimarinus]|uniref:DUF2219 domain-containing protein n=1 Tax=Polaribacter aquimarinus TaxID=2100726 RepID=A0A2U2J9Q4_9FLAO|nr:lipid A deacylase LpxR family protein [Polaribacter aquimarinus]PWG04991.1 DUF2219 domain-containing protein [Polaribacter aquimarinus]
MKYLTLILLLFCSFYSVCQEKFSKEIGFVTDNDLYISKSRDRYYTSGIFINYRFISHKKSQSLEKLIYEWQLGHEMYTPNKAIVTNIIFHDRPFAAHLYTGFKMDRIYKSKKIFSTNIQLGFIGPNALGKEVQDFIHNIYGFRKAVGWKHQIKSALSLNFNFGYSHFLLKNKKNNLDVTWINKVRLGSTFTNASVGLYGRFGFKALQSIVNSIAFNTNLNNNNNAGSRGIESFLFVKPTLQYAIYDATLQGSFLNTKSEVTKELIPIVFNIQIGYKFTVNRFNFGYIFNYNTSKSKGLKHTYGNKYGSIIINYLLH